MDKITPEQADHILQNLCSLESSYLEYSHAPKDFSAFRTYVDYFNNTFIRSRNLFRFYFPMPIEDGETALGASGGRSLKDLPSLSDSDTVLPGFPFSICKLFGFPEGPRHCCSYYSLFALLDGAGSILLDTTRLDMKPGDFCLIPPGTYYALDMQPDALCICLDLRVSFLSADYKNIFQDDPRLTDFITRTLASDDGEAWLRLRSAPDAAVRGLLCSIFAEYINREPYADHAMRSYLSLLFTMLLRQPDTEIESSLPVGRAYAQYRQIRDFIREHYATATLSGTADAVHFSKQYVCRIVKDTTGGTFNDLLMQTRLSMAEQYLVDSTLSLERISELCGFSSAAHFSRTFKQHFGKSPSEYRKNRR